MQRHYPGLLSFFGLSKQMNDGLWVMLTGSLGANRFTGAQEKRTSPFTTLIRPEVSQ